MKMKCPECGYEFKEYEMDNYQMGDIVSCPCCGSELELKNGTLIILSFEGEDWGELIGLFKLRGKPNCYRSWKRKNTMLNIW